MLPGLRAEKGMLEDYVIDVNGSFMLHDLFTK